MNADNPYRVGMPDPVDVASPGRSPFAERGRTVMGKLALAFSLAPWAAFGLMYVLQPG